MLFSLHLCFDGGNENVAGDHSVLRGETVGKIIGVEVLNNLNHNEGTLYICLKNENAKSYIAFKDIPEPGEKEIYLFDKMKMVILCIKSYKIY